MAWEKRGLIYVPDGQQWWARSRAHLPTVHQIDSERLRVYFAGLDEEQYGRIGYVDLDATNPSRVLEVGREPVLDLGEPGTFDESGVNPVVVLNVDGDQYLYYVGWQRLTSAQVRYLVFAGLAISSNGGPFKRYARTPILERTDREPFIRSAMTVLREGQGFRGWYVSATGWTTIDGRPLPSYVIRMATSEDGIHWQAEERPVISLLDEEFGLGRPWVIQADGLYKMWYSIRSRSRPYRIGYAESLDGVSWLRKDDEIDITTSDDGWDSEMICYPCVIMVNESTLMFYNGNGYGTSGFGYAIWKD